VPVPQYFRVFTATDELGGVAAAVGREGARRGADAVAHLQRHVAYTASRTARTSKRHG
jgi:hypothetical protein